MNTKPWYQSFTLWFNILAALGGAFALLASAYPAEGWITLVLAAINFALRFKSKAAIE